MKLPLIATGTLLVSGFLLPLSAHAADRGKVLLDFTDSRRDREVTGHESVIHCYDYQWGDWDKGRVIDKRRVGALIKAPTSSGQLGDGKTMVVFGRTPAAELDYVVGPGNQGKNLSFRLTDNDGTEAEWTIPLEGKTANILTSVRFEYAHPNNISKEGKIPGLDLQHIAGWEIHGDWSKSPVEVILVKLVSAQ
jgi:hypothetical protein